MEQMYHILLVPKIKYYISTTLRGRPLGFPLEAPSSILYTPFQRAEIPTPNKQYLNIKI